jgi:hypothetical protein
VYHSPFCNDHWSSYSACCMITGSRKCRCYSQKAMLSSTFFSLSSRLVIHACIYSSHCLQVANKWLLDLPSPHLPLTPSNDVPSRQALHTFSSSSLIFPFPFYFLGSSVLSVPSRGSSYGAGNKQCLRISLKTFARTKPS